MCLERKLANFLPNLNLFRFIETRQICYVLEQLLRSFYRAAFLELLLPSYPEVEGEIWCNADPKGGKELPLGGVEGIDGEKWRSNQGSA